MTAGPNVFFSTVTLQAALNWVPSVVVAVIVVVPDCFATTTPALLTTATEVLLEVQLNVGLLALLGNTVGISVSLSPSNIMVDVLLSVTLVTGWTTVNLQEALNCVPSVVVAVIVVAPARFAVTTPLALTVATLVLLEVHTTDELVTLFGKTVALSVADSPTFRVSVEGLTLTEVANTLTGAFGLMPIIAACQEL